MYVDTSTTLEDLDLTILRGHELLQPLTPHSLAPITRVIPSKGHVIVICRGGTVVLVLDNIGGGAPSAAPEALSGSMVFDSDSEDGHDVGMGAVKGPGRVAIDTAKLFTQIDSMGPGWVMESGMLVVKVPKGSEVIHVETVVSGMERLLLFQSDGTVASFTCDTTTDPTSLPVWKAAGEEPLLADSGDTSEAEGERARDLRHVCLDDLGRSIVWVERERATGIDTLVVRQVNFFERHADLGMVTSIMQFRGEAEGEGEGEGGSEGMDNVVPMCVTGMHRGRGGVYLLGHSPASPSTPLCMLWLSGEEDVCSLGCAVARVPLPPSTTASVVHPGSGHLILLTLHDTESEEREREGASPETQGKRGGSNTSSSPPPLLWSVCPTHPSPPECPSRGSRPLRRSHSHASMHSNVSEWERSVSGATRPSPSTLDSASPPSSSTCSTFPCGAEGDVSLPCVHPQPLCALSHCLDTPPGAESVSPGCVDMCFVDDVVTLQVRETEGKADSLKAYAFNIHTGELLSHRTKRHTAISTSLRDISTSLRERERDMERSRGGGRHEYTERDGGEEGEEEVPSKAPAASVGGVISMPYHAHLPPSLAPFQAGYLWPGDSLHQASIFAHHPGNPAVSLSSTLSRSPCHAPDMAYTVLAGLATPSHSPCLSPSLASGGERGVGAGSVGLLYRLRRRVLPETLLSDLYQPLGAEAQAVDTLRQTCLDHSWSPVSASSPSPVSASTPTRASLNDAALMEERGYLSRSVVLGYLLAAPVTSAQTEGAIGTVGTVGTVGRASPEPTPSLAERMELASSLLDSCIQALLGIESAALDSLSMVLPPSVVSSPCPTPSNSLPSRAGGWERERLTQEEKEREGKRDALCHAVVCQIARVAAVHLIDLCLQRAAGLMPAHALSASSLSPPMQTKTLGGRERERGWSNQREQQGEREGRDMLLYAGRLAGRLCNCLTSVFGPLYGVVSAVSAVTTFSPALFPPRTLLPRTEHGLGMRPEDRDGDSLSDPLSLSLALPQYPIDPQAPLASVAALHPLQMALLGERAEPLVDTLLGGGEDDDEGEDSAYEETSMTERERERERDTLPLRPVRHSHRADRAQLKEWLRQAPPGPTKGRERERDRQSRSVSRGRRGSSRPDPLLSSDVLLARAQHMARERERETHSDLKLALPGRSGMDDLDQALSPAGYRLMRKPRPAVFEEESSGDVQRVEREREASGDHPPFPLSMYQLLSRSLSMASSSSASAAQDVLAVSALTCAAVVPPSSTQTQGDTAPAPTTLTGTELLRRLQGEMDVKACEEWERQRQRHKMTTLDSPPRSRATDTTDAEREREREKERERQRKRARAAPQGPVAVLTPALLRTPMQAPWLTGHGLAVPQQVALYAAVCERCLPGGSVAALLKGGYVASAVAVARALAYVQTHEGEGEREDVDDEECRSDALTRIIDEEIGCGEAYLQPLEAAILASSVHTVVESLSVPDSGDSHPHPQPLSSPLLSVLHGRDADFTTDTWWGAYGLPGAGTDTPAPTAGAGTEGAVLWLGARGRVDEVATPSAEGAEGVTPIGPTPIRPTLGTSVCSVFDTVDRAAVETDALTVGDLRAAFM
ncbi:hypothetical protein KIPB_003240 [Kipferlia bialata]|uniref:Uncharacterized protein n=1 Tax=Kipferlia bialata TaxID=797122 RepID=A0A9K3GFN0_9EUKA|nr:hypothetical protein KIPB_003240 [Kipferlia bialata]|eukprot:g3240.t1